MNLHQAITECQNGDPDETAKAVFARLGVPAKWREMFYSVVRHACWVDARSIIRSSERLGGHRAHDNQSVAAADRSDILKRLTHVNDEIGMMPTDQMTVEHHELRIAYLQRYRAGIDASIVWHRDVIATLTAAGVSCLAELEEVGA